MTRFLLTLMFSGLMMMQAQAQASKTFLKTLSLDGATDVVLALDGKLVVTEWNENYLRVETNITATNIDEFVLKQLAEAGRYRLEAVLDGTSLVVTCPKVSRKAVVSGQPVNEQFMFQVFVPKGYGTQQTAPPTPAAPVQQTAPMQAVAAPSM